MKFFCPKCELKLEAGADVQGCVECPSCSEVIDLSALRAATCPICGCSFEEDDEIRTCPDCKTPHHAECWDENRGCSTYGCSSAAHQETHTTGGAGDIPLHTSQASRMDAASGMIPCPACGAMHPATDLVCSACGKLLKEDLPGDSVGAGLNETFGRLGGAAKASLWPRLTRNFHLLGRDVAAVFGLWWGEFSRYARFSGKTTRRGYVTFWMVNCLAVWLFELSEAALLVLLFSLLVFLPTLASTVRRLRDTDISPWMVFALPILPFLLLAPSVSADSTDLTEETTS